MSRCAASGNSDAAHDEDHDGKLPLTPFIVCYETRRRFTHLLAHQL